MPLAPSRCAVPIHHNSETLLIFLWTGSTKWQDLRAVELCRRSALPTPSCCFFILQHPSMTCARHVDSTDSTWPERSTTDLSPAPHNRSWQDLSAVEPSPRSARSHLTRGQTSSLTQKPASFRSMSRDAPGFCTVPTPVQ